MTFGPDCIVGFDGHLFSVVWPHFEVSEVEDSITVGNCGLDPNVVYPLGGHTCCREKIYAISSRRFMGESARL